MERLKLSILSALLILGLVASLWFVSNSFPNRQQKVGGMRSENDYLLLKNSPTNPLNIKQTINLGNQRQLAHVYHLFRSLSGLAIIDYENNFLEWLPEAQIVPTSPPSRHEAPGDHLQWLGFEDLGNTYNTRELIVQYANPGTAGVHPFYLYSYDGSEFELLLKLVEASSKTEIKDLDNDGFKEIIHEFSISGIGKLERDLLRWKDIWRLEGGKPVKVNSQFPQEYKDLIDLYNLALNKKEWIPDVSYYYPTLECLKEKAEATIQKKQVEIKECRN